MEHSYFQDRLSAYHDNELPLQEKVVVEQHLHDCPECRKQLAEYARLDQLVIDHGQLGDTDYWEQAAKKIEKEIGVADPTRVASVFRARQRLALTWKLAALAASVVIVGYLGIHRDQIFPPEKVVPAQSAPAISQPPSAAAQKPVMTDSALRRDVGKSAMKEAEPTRQADAKTNELRTGAVDRDAEHKLQSKPAYRDTKGEVASTPAVPTDTKFSEKQTTLDRAAAPAAEIAQNAPAAARSAIHPEAISGAARVAGQDIVADTVAKSLAAPPVTDASPEIAFWRTLKDSLLASANRKDALTLSATKALTSQYQQSAKKVRPTAAAADTVKKDEQLSRAWYQIARLTPSDSEKTVAVNALQKIAAGGSPSAREKARTYLDSLGHK